MSNQHLVLNPTSRQAITEVAPNDNSAPLLEDLVFRDGETAISLSLSVTDAIDAIAASLQNIVSAGIEATDSPDSIEGTIKNIVSAVIAGVDDADNAEVTATTEIAISVAAIDTRDMATIDASVDISATIGAVDRQDRASIRIPSKKQTGGFIPMAPIAAWLRKRQAVLISTDQPDSAHVSITQTVRVATVAAERKDAVAFTSTVKNAATMKASDVIDVVENNIEEFQKYVDDVYRTYEYNQIMSILAAA